jgi:CRISPR-associated protein Csx3
MSSIEIIREGQVIKVSFGNPAQNNVIVKDALVRLNEMADNGELSGRGAILIDGPTTLAVGMVISHALADRFQVIGVLDPKLSAYVVVISNDPLVKVGDLIKK